MINNLATQEGHLTSWVAFLLPTFPPEYFSVYTYYMKSKEEITKDALSFLLQQNVGSLATAGLDGTPSVSPVYFAVLPDFSIYFSTSHHTQKFKNLTLNPKVAFSAGHGPGYEVISIQGTARMLNEADRKEAQELITARVRNSMSSWPIKTVKTLEEGGIAVFKITPDTAFFLTLNSEDQLASTDKYFYQILP